MGIGDRVLSETQHLGPETLYSEPDPLLSSFRLSFGLVSHPLQVRGQPLLNR